MGKVITIFQFIFKIACIGLCAAALGVGCSGIFGSEWFKKLADKREEELEKLEIGKGIPLSHVFVAFIAIAVIISLMSTGLHMAAVGDSYAIKGKFINIGLMVLGAIMAFAGGMVLLAGTSSDFEECKTKAWPFFEEVLGQKVMSKGEVNEMCDKQVEKYTQEYPQAKQLCQSLADNSGGNWDEDTVKEKVNELMKSQSVQDMLLRFQTQLGTNPAPKPSDENNDNINQLDKEEIQQLMEKLWSKGNKNELDNYQYNFKRSARTRSGRNGLERSGGLSDTEKEAKCITIIGKKKKTIGGVLGIVAAVFFLIISVLDCITKAPTKDSDPQNPSNNPEVPSGLPLQPQPSKSELEQNSQFPQNGNPQNYAQQPPPLGQNPPPMNYSQQGPPPGPYQSPPPGPPMVNYGPPPTQYQQQ